MRRTSLRVALAFLAAIAIAWGLGAAFEATFLVRVHGPTSPFHVPTWLEPYAYTVQLLCDLAPGIVFGTIARWRPILLGLIAGFVFFYLSALLPENREAAFSSWGLDWAFRHAIYWAAGATIGSYLSSLWMPNTSLERTRER
jgi:hypothetical protein